MTALQVYLSEEDALVYQEWVDDSLTDEAYADHDELLAQVLNVSANPVDTMLRDLTAGRFA
ncbi:hypothetical protein [Curtobacterium sp. PhB191]|uniref:hypothetical protein n=1 Tax=Curtobacterium sp. PhB191 TaxID=2485202 RepID=UPI00104BCA12|nr:hypothetical protein [Curtobacterium sp. PhB191]